MNILFMIGNGFDIKIGLATRFSDFFNEYKRPQDGDNEIIKNFKENINDNIETWADFEKRFGEYSEEFNLNDYYGDDYLWCLKDFRKEFVTYLKHEERRINYKIPPKNILDVFSYSIQHFYKELPQLRHDMIKKVIDDKSLKYNYNFISFNYTSIFDKCIELSINNGIFYHNYRASVIYDIANKPLHIHGTLDAPVLIGVDNTEQIKNKEFASNERIVRALVKKRVNEDEQEGNDETGGALIKESNIICVFGMSIGETDKVWWQRIGEWLQQDKSHQLVVFDYYYEYDPNDFPTKRDKEDIVYNRFFSLSELQKEEQELCKP